MSPAMIKSVLVLHILPHGYYNLLSLVGFDMEGCRLQPETFSEGKKWESKDAALLSASSILCVVINSTDS